MSLSFLMGLSAIAVVASGTAVQAALGFGLALVAAPLLYLIDPVFVPGPMMAVTLVLSAWIAWGERQQIEVRHIKSALGGRIVGSGLAVVVLGLASAQTFDLLFGALVLVAVVLSVARPPIVPGRGTVFSAMLASGAMGTLSGIDGPPLALLHQHDRGAALRANLAVLFLMGSSISLVALTVIGHYGALEVRATGLLLLGVVPGYWCASYLKRHLDNRNVRPFLLGLCCFAALLVLGRAVRGMWN